MSFQIALLVPAALAFAFTALVCFFARPLGDMLGLVDCPTKKAHSRHEVPTPLVGGLAVLTPLIVTYFVSRLLFDPGIRLAYWQSAPFFVSSVAVMLLLGMLDDRFHLSVRSRLIIAGVTFLALVSFHPAFRIEQFVLPLFRIGVPVTLGWLAIPFTVLCLVALANAVNMSDGRNGLVIGLGLVWTLAFLSCAPAPYLPGLLILLASLVAGFAFNVRGRLFLGDGGTYGLATVFGLTAIWFHNLEGANISAAQIGVLFLVPALDMVRLILTRWRWRVSAFSADQGHLHHYLDDWIGWRRGLPLYLGLVALPVAIAFAAPRWGGEALVLGAALYFVVFAMARVQLRLARTPEVA